MELNVTILNFLSYSDKKTGDPMVRIGYISNDKVYIKNTKSMKGYSELSVFVDDKDGLYDKLKVEMTGDTAIFVFDKKPNPYNPMRDILVLKEIRTNKHGNISIL